MPYRRKMCRSTKPWLFSVLLPKGHVNAHMEDVELLEFMGRPGVTAKALQKRHDTLRRLVRDLGVAAEGSDLLLDLLAHETVLRLLQNRERHFAWELRDLDFEVPDDE
jgi:hypothetical protein